MEKKIEKNGLEITVEINESLDLASLDVEKSLVFDDIEKMIEKGYGKNACGEEMFANEDTGIVYVLNCEATGEKSRKVSVGSVMSTKAVFML